MFPTPVFQQIPALDAPFKITALDYCDNKLYLGDESGTIYKYNVRTDQPNNIIPNPKDFQMVKMPVKGKIQAIKYLQYANQVLVHADKQLYLFDGGESMTKTQEIINSKDCEMFALDEDPRSIDKSIARLLVVKSDLKMAFYEYEKVGRGEFKLRSDNVKALKRPTAIAWFGKNIFYGTEKSSYQVMDCETKQFRNLDAFKDLVLPRHIIKIISDLETIFLGPSDFFIPINSVLCDKLHQNPINAMPKLAGISVLDPYIIMLGDNKIQVYNKFYNESRPRLLQEEAFEASGSNVGRGISVTSNKVFFATTSRVYYLQPVPYEQQITRCLQAGRVDDAFMVFNQYVSETDPDRQRKLDQLKIDAAWIFFKDLKFKETEKIIRDLNFDIKEFLSLFINYTTKKNLLEGKVTIGALSQEASKRPSADNDLKKDPDRAMKAARESLAYLLDNRRKYFLDKNLKDIPEFIFSENFSPFRDEIRAGRIPKLTVEEHLEIIDYALLRVYLDLGNESKLNELLSTKLYCKDSVKDLEGCFVEERKVSDAILAKFFEQFGRYKDALEVWSASLLQSEKSKVDRACDEMIRILTKFTLYFKESKEKDTLFDYFAKIVRKNANFARTFFLQIDNKIISPDSLQKNLQKKLPEMTFLNEVFLEVLVNEKKIEDDKFHTALALHYVKSIFEIKKKDQKMSSQTQNLTQGEEKQLNDYRRKLNNFLKDPQARYSPDAVLSQIKDSWLLDEEIYLYGAIKQHNEALNKMLNQNMYDKAEKYCADKQERLLTKLFELYLKKYNEYSEAVRQAPDDSKMKGKRENIKNIIQTFLKKYAAHPQLDPAAVVDKIPDDWTLSADDEDDKGVYSFLLYSLSSTLHTKRNARVAKYLSELDSLNTQYKLLKAQSAHVTINNSRRCALCNKTIGRTVFVVYPNGVIAHHSCSLDKLTVCPVTKQNFEKTFSG